MATSTYPQTRSRAHSIARWAPLALRLVWGVIFFAHGVSKFSQINHTVQLLTRIGIPFADVVAPLIAAIEVIGGVALILGVGVRLFALIFASMMVVAIIMVKLKSGLLGGFELELALLAGCITLMITGAGVLSLTGHGRNTRGA